MTKLFLAIFIPILFILGTPVLIGAIMYDGSGDQDMPTYLYTEDADAEKMLYKELSDSISDVESELTTDMVFNLHQDIINTAIFELFSAEDVNPNYMPGEDCDSDECNFVFSEVQQVEGFDIGLRIVGAWVDFQDDKFIANLFLEINFDNGFAYKTIIEVHFSFRDLPDKYELEFEKIQIGSLPIPKALISSVLDLVDKQIDQVDIQEQADDMPIGDLDISSMSYTLMKDDILAELQSSQEGGDETGGVLAQEVLSIIFDNELIKFSFEEEEFLLTAAISKFKSEESDIPSYLYDLHDRVIIDDVEVIGDYNPLLFDMESYLIDKFTEYVFNYALAPDSDFTINERTFNKIIYSTTDGFSDTRTTYEYVNDLGEIEIIDIGLKAIWFELAPDEIYINALFRIAGIDSLLQIVASEVPTSSTAELAFEFTEISFGKDEGEFEPEYLGITELEVFTDLFESMDSIPFGTFADGVLTLSASSLTDLMQDGSTEGAIIVNEISLVQDGIVLDIEPSMYTDLLDAFTTGLNEVLEDPALLTGLEDALDTETDGPEQDVYNGVVALQTELLDEGEVDIELVTGLVTDMFENFEDMDPESQTAFLEAFEDLIGDAFGDIYSSLETTP
jgi:hypothetical protein